MGKASGVYDAVNGRVGNVVWYSVRGKNILRIRPAGYTDRKSESQLGQRDTLKIIRKIVSSFKEVLRITYNVEGAKSSPYHQALGYNMRNAVEGKYPDIRVGYEKVQLSKGNLSLPLQVTATPEEGGFLLQWVNTPYDINNYKNDTLVIMGYYSGSKEIDYAFTEARRSDGRYFWKTDFAGYPREEVHIWIAFRDREQTDFSGTMYAGRD